ncbi:MAG TPA: ATP-dependent DNA ligase [Verrucomicrobiae bacterium]|jgi:DNA ligase-1
MKRFAQLYSELDQTNRTNEKVAALESYFREAAPADAVWALYFLCGRKLPQAINSTSLRAIAAEESQLAPWLLDECYQAVGDLAETLALILPQANSQSSLALHQLVEERLLPLQVAGQSGRALLLRTWRELDSLERFIWNKLITGNFRVGVAQTLVARALAAVAGIEAPVMAHRLMGQWQPNARDFERIINGKASLDHDLARPYPFFLASPLNGPLAELGDLQDWQIEWKWDGIRGQLIRRQNQVLVWSRGDEMVNNTFPEIAAMAEALPDGIVLDGEILAWENETPQPFGRLQRRLGRKLVSAKTQSQFPVVFLAFDLLEWEGNDWRQRPLKERHDQLEAIVSETMSNIAVKTNNSSPILETPDLFEQSTPLTARLSLRLSPLIHVNSWEDLARLRAESRARNVEGIMLKRLTSQYGVGRLRGDWWKWKIEPLVMDAVLINAQLGHGRRASLYTDYTFGVWHAGKLVPVAKAYSGLSDEEIAEVDKFVRANTEDTFGPIRAVKPELVFELAFEGIQKSTRHKSGLAVRFPRMNRWRRDKKPKDADTLETLQALMEK